jgi:hypothetical protein
MQMSQKFNLMHSKSQNVKGWKPFNFQLLTFWFFGDPKSDLQILIYKTPFSKVNKKGI